MPKVVEKLPDPLPKKPILANKTHAEARGLARERPGCWVLLDTAYKSARSAQSAIGQFLRSPLWGGFSFASRGSEDGTARIYVRFAP